MPRENHGCEPEFYSCREGEKAPQLTPRRRIDGVKMFIVQMFNVGSAFCGMCCFESDIVSSL